MCDSETIAKKLKDEFKEKRGEHLKKLYPLEELVHKYAPLPASYDISRIQPPFFNEFSYTELMGCLYVSPQSNEAAARLVQAAIESSNPFTKFDVANNLSIRDKYVLDDINLPYKKVIILPGTNIFKATVSKENLLRVMHENPDAMLKLHPLTDEGLTRYLGITFGYKRLIGGDVSGANIIKNSNKLWVTTSTELGLYACLLKKPIFNITNFISESIGTFNPFYRLIWNKSPEEADLILRRAINNPISGIFHPDDPDIESKISFFFDETMKWREAYRPLVVEYTIEDWQSMMVNKINKPQGSKRNVVSQSNEEPRNT